MASCIGMRILLLLLLLLLLRLCIIVILIIATVISTVSTIITFMIVNTIITSITIITIMSILRTSIIRLITVINSKITISIIGRIFITIMMIAIFYSVIVRFLVMGVCVIFRQMEAGLSRLSAFRFIFAICHRYFEGQRDLISR